MPLLHGVVERRGSRVKSTLLARVSREVPYDSDVLWCWLDSAKRKRTRSSKDRRRSSELWVGRERSRVEGKGMKGRGKVCRRL